MCDRGATFGIAKVVCRQLGYLEPLAIKTGAYFGEGTGTVWLEPRDSCTRKSTLKKTLEDCQNLFNKKRTPRWGESKCNHSMDLGVVCSGESMQARIVQCMCTCQQASHQPLQLTPASCMQYGQQIIYCTHNQSYICNYVCTCTENYNFDNNNNF